MRHWQPKYELATTEERKKYIEECIASGEYELTPSLLDRMGTYMLHPHDKEHNIKEQKPIKQDQKIKVQKMQETGVRYCTTPKVMTRKEKMIKYPETKAYYDLIDYCDKKGINELGADGYSSTFDLRIKNPHLSKSLKEIGSKSAAKSIYDELHADIEETIQLYKNREVKIHPMNCGSLGRLRLDDVDYNNEYVIRELLSQYQSICAKAAVDPDSTEFALKLDIEKMITKTELTATQRNIINKVLYTKESLSKKEFDVFYRACRRISYLFDKKM